MIVDGEQIIIQNDLVSIGQWQTSRQVRLDDFLAGLETKAPLTLPTIARSQVFAHYDESERATKKFFALTEIAPGIRSISKNLSDRTSARRYRLAMPWTYIWFGCFNNSGVGDESAWGINQYRIFHARQRYAGLDSEMITARLPNVYSDGSICWGATGVSPGMSLADRLDQLTNEWYATRFNSDLDGNVSLPYGEVTYARWVRESTESPTCWMNWPEWTDRNAHKYTVRNLLEENAIRPRTEEIVLDNSIPEIPVRLTIGRWEEFFLEHVPVEERARARIAIENIAADNPDNVPAVPETIIERLEDGGIDIPYMR